MVVHTQSLPWCSNSLEVRRVHGAATVLLLLLLCYSHQRHFNGPTAVSRLSLLHAICVRGALDIGDYPITPDKAKYAGHYYSDKAPGTVALALPVFLVSAGVIRVVGVPLDSEKGWLVSSWVACAGSLGILTALGGAALFAWLCRWVPPRHALVTTLALFLGAAPLPYATMMFSHALVVGLLAIAVWALDRKPGDGRREMGRKTEGGGQTTEVRSQRSEGRHVWSYLAANRWPVVAGHACGWALASEYTAGIIVIAIFVGLVLPWPTKEASSGPPGVPSRRWLAWVSGLNRKRAWAFCVGALPPLLLIPAYSWATVGSPFTLPYSYQASFPEMQQGLYAIKWPDLETAYNLLFSPTRGLFFWTPFLFMAGVGYWALYERSPRWFWLSYAVPLLHIVVISGRVWDWQAGPTLGPRYLAPILPLLALPCAFGVLRFPRLGATLAAYSILITTLATLTDACPAYNTYNPLTEAVIPLFSRGEFSPNLGMVLGLPPYASVTVYYVILIGGVWWLWRRLPAAGPAVVSEHPASGSTE